MILLTRILYSLIFQDEKLITLSFKWPDFVFTKTYLQITDCKNQTSSQLSGRMKLKLTYINNMIISESK